MRKVKILIVVDMQNDFIDGSLGTPEAQAIVSKVVEKIQNWRGEVYATLDFHNQNYLNTIEGQKLPIKHCIEHTDGIRIQKEVFEALEKKGTYCFVKETFGSIRLFNRLKQEKEINGWGTTTFGTFRLCDEAKISEIQLIGLCTDICVVSNALLAKAFFPEVPIIVDASCCAGTTPENHKAALQVMKCCQVDIINEEDSND